MSWPMVELSDLVEVMHQGINTAADKVNYSDSGVPIIQAKHLKEGFVDFSDVKFLGDSDYEKYKEKYIPQINDLLFSNIGTIGKSVIVKNVDKFMFAWNVFIIRVKHESLDVSFFKYYLDRLLSINYYEQFLTGGTVKFVNKKTIGAIKVPLPPLAEQKRIAAILDKADAIRQKRQQAIKLADEFLRSVFLEMFGDPVTNPKGWDEQVLKKIADIRSGVAKGKKVSLEDSVTLPYMRVANVQDGYLDLSDIKQIVVSKKDAKKCQLKKGDVLLTEGGDPDKLGRGYVWNGEIENCIHQNHIFSVRVDKHDVIHPDFLSAQISSQRGKRYFLKVGKQTTGIATINKTVLSDFVVFIPSIESQKRYVEIKNKVDLFKKKCELDGRDLFHSIVNKAFSGGI